MELLEIYKNLKDPNCLLLNRTKKILRCQTKIEIPDTNNSTHIKL